MPPESCLTRHRVPVEPAGGRASGGPQPASPSAFLFGRPRWGWRHRGRSEAFGCCITQLPNTHKFDKKKILYEFHPWFGRDLSVQGVVEKGMGAVRCTLQGDVQARALEVPRWMFDRLTCLSVRLRRRPQVDLAALDALQSLLAEVSGSGDPTPSVFSIVPDSITDVPSVSQDQGGDHGSISTGSVRSREARPFREHAAMAESAASDAPEGGPPDGKAVHRTLADAGDRRHGADRRSSTR